jgi:hypothetical protein
MNRSRDVVALFILVILLRVPEIVWRRVPFESGAPPRWAVDLGRARNKEEGETAAAAPNPTNELRVIKSRADDPTCLEGKGKRDALLLMRNP